MWTIVFAASSDRIPLILNKLYNLWKQHFAVFLTWFFNDRVLSISTPSKVVESDLDTDSSQMVIGGKFF